MWHLKAGDYTFVTSNLFQTAVRVWDDPWISHAEPCQWALPDYRSRVADHRINLKLGLRLALQVQIIRWVSCENVITLINAQDTPFRCSSAPPRLTHNCHGKWKHDVRSVNAKQLRHPPRISLVGCYGNAAYSCWIHTLNPLSVDCVMTCQCHINKWHTRQFPARTWEASVLSWSLPSLIRPSVSSVNSKRKHLSCFKLVPSVMKDCIVDLTYAACCLLG